MNDAAASGAGEPSRGFAALGAAMILFRAAISRRVFKETA